MAARASKCFVRSAPGPCKYTSYPGVVCAMLRCCDMFAELPPPIAAEVPFNFSLARDAFLHQCGSAMRAVDLHTGQAEEDPLACGSCGSQGRRHCRRELRVVTSDSAWTRPLSACRNTRGSDPTTEHPCLSMDPPRARMSFHVLPHRNVED